MKQELYIHNIHVWTLSIVQVGMFSLVFLVPKVQDVSMAHHRQILVLLDSIRIKLVKQPAIYVLLAFIVTLLVQSTHKLVFQAIHALKAQVAGTIIHVLQAHFPTDLTSNQLPNVQIVLRVSIA